MVQDLIAGAPGLWPWALSLLGLGLPRLVRELRRLIYARTVSRLGKAVIDNPQWSDQRFRLVIGLIRDVDRNSAPGVAADNRPAESAAPVRPRTDEE